MYGTVILQREIYRSGRNVCRINGMLVNTSTLKQLGETIVDIHGQNEHQELMQPDKHLRLLDEFGGDELSSIRSRYQATYQDYQHLHHSMVSRNTHQKEWAQRLDMLRFQVKEIEDAQLQPDEETALSQQRPVNELSEDQHIAAGGFLGFKWWWRVHRGFGS